MVSRRSVLKGTVLALAGGATTAIRAELAPRATEAESLAFRPVFPGVWKATLGVPESYTPVSGRTIPPDAQGLARMASPSVPPITGISWKSRSARLPAHPAARAQ
jgi:hypothetical protein